MDDSGADPLWEIFGALADVERALKTIADVAPWVQALFETSLPPEDFDFRPETNRAGLPQPEWAVEARRRSEEIAPVHFERFQTLWDLFDAGRRAARAALLALPKIADRLDEGGVPLLRRTSTAMGKDILAARDLLTREPTGPRPPAGEKLALEATAIVAPISQWIDLIRGAVQAAPYIDDAQSEQSVPHARPGGPMPGPQAKGKRKNQQKERQRKRLLVEAALRTDEAMQIRRDRRLTYNDLAELTNIPRATLNSYDFIRDLVNEFNGPDYRGLRGFL